MTLLPTRRLFVVAAIFAGIVPPAAADEPLLKYLPGDATNAVTVVRVGDILKKSGADAAEGLPVPGAEAIPPWVDLLVVGSQVRPGSRERVRTVAVARLRPGTSFEAVAADRGRTADRIGDFAAAVTPRGDYLIGLAPDVVALVRPGVRQEVARWLASTARPAPLVPFLAEAAQRPADLVFALDLRDALSADRVRSWLDSRPGGELRGVDSELAAALLPRLVGVSLEIDMRKEATVLRVRFDGPVTLDAEPLRALFVELLRDAHASVPEFEAAPAAVEGQELVLRTPLSEDSARRILSLLLAPSDPPPGMAIRPGDATDPAKASLDYFHAVDEIVKDLDRARKRATDDARTAVWHENFARKIEELPAASVDPALVDYGLQTAARMRALAASLRGVAVQVDAQQRAVTYDVQVDPGYVGYNIWGGVGVSPGTWQVSSNLRDVRERQAAAVAEGATQRDEIWRLIADDRAAVARQMTDKFGAPFDAPSRRR